MKTLYYVIDWPVFSPVNQFVAFSANKQWIDALMQNSIIHVSVLNADGVDENFHAFYRLSINNLL